MPTDQPYNKSEKEIYAEKVIKMKRKFIAEKQANHSSDNRICAIIIK